MVGGWSDDLLFLMIVCIMLVMIVLILFGVLLGIVLVMVWIGVGWLRFLISLFVGRMCVWGFGLKLSLGSGLIGVNSRFLRLVGCVDGSGVSFGLLLCVDVLMVLIFIVIGWCEIVGLRVRNVLCCNL